MLSLHAQSGTRRVMPCKGYSEHQHYIASGVLRKQVKHFYNCIMEPIFNIPIEQVNMHFVKFFCITTYTCIHNIHVHIHTQVWVPPLPPRASHHIGHLYKGLWFA